MSQTNRNFVFAYAFLVILPLVGVAGILKSGRKLVAPVSIDGLWNLQVDSAQLDSLPCGKILASDKTIAISQSGGSLVLSFPSDTKGTASGTLDGTTLRASLMQSGSPSDASCGGRQLSILASVNGTPESRSLMGTLSVANCPACASVAFRADRQAPAPSKGGH